jgi:hypothetical protein
LTVMKNKFTDYRHSIIVFTIWVSKNVRKAILHLKYFGCLDVYSCYEQKNP